MNTGDRQKAYRAGLGAETIAALFLTFKGYRVIARRYKSPVGEIDLIARRGKTLVFIEVKTWSSREGIAYSISPRQQDRIRRAASAFLGQNPTMTSLTSRFDAVFIVPWRSFQHIRDAWQ